MQRSGGKQERRVVCRGEIGKQKDQGQEEGRDRVNKRRGLTGKG